MWCASNGVVWVVNDLVEGKDTATTHHSWKLQIVSTNMEKTLRKMSRLGLQLIHVIIVTPTHLSECDWPSRYLAVHLKLIYQPYFPPYLLLSPTQQHSTAKWGFNTYLSSPKYSSCLRHSRLSTSLNTSRGRYCLSIKANHQWFSPGFHSSDPPSSMVLTPTNSTSSIKRR